MARSGLSNLIRRVRGMTQVGTADYSLVIGDGSTVFWWGDDHIYDVMDLYRADYQFVQMQAAPEQIAGSVIYKDYYLPNQNWEEATSGSAYWLVTDTIGSAIGTADYSVDYVKGVVRFNNDQAGSARMFTGKSYDLNSAAADIWRQKAANAALYFNFSTDRQSFSRSQFFDHCMAMASHYDGQSGFSVTRFERDDLLSGGGEVNGKLHDGGIPANGGWY